VEAPTTLDAVPSFGKKLMAHPPKPYDIVEGMEHIIDMMEEILQICERAKFSTQHASHRNTFPFGLRAPSGVYTRHATKSIQIQSGQQQPSGDLKVEPHARRDPLDVPCIYPKGAQHTLRGCRLRKKIDEEHDVTCATQAPTSPDGGEFQKARIRISPNDQRSTRQCICGLSERPTVGWHDGFRGSTSDPSQREPCTEAGRGVAPGSIPMCPRPTPRVRRGGASDVQQPLGQPWRGVGTSPVG
jgi:hypothetical protein